MRLWPSALSSLVFGVLLAMAAPARAAEPTEAPAWGASELRDLFNRIQLSSRAQRYEEKDAQLVTVAGFAYRVEHQGTESVDAYAKRVLKARVPTHPTVKSGQWLNALMSIFYADVSKRCEALARFEKSREDRAYFDKMGKEAGEVAKALAKEVETTFEGSGGFSAPLPVAAACEPPTKPGAVASVRGGKVSIENLERVVFKDDQPPEDAARTGTGALREIFAAQKQYNVSAQMLGNYEDEWRQNRGNLRVSIPAASPAIYLNELVRGGVEAGMQSLFIMVISRENALCELRIPLVEPKGKKAAPTRKGGKIRSKATEVHCPDDALMQKCVDHLVNARTKGPIRFTIE